MSLHTAPESLFWYWIAERHSIFLAREAELPKPWTKDPILQRYKFTNPFRENDRGTVWLRENFLEPHREFEHDDGCASNSEILSGILAPCDCYIGDHNLSLLAFNICWYRMFNWWGTGEALGWQTHWDGIKFRETLTARLAKGEQVFTGAHIVYSPPGRPKIDAIVDVCRDLYHMCFDGNALITCVKEERSLEAVFNGLTSVHCVGGFMAYEMVSDMRHTRLLEDAKDIMTWANPGPGARRGLQRLQLPWKPDPIAIYSMQGLLDRVPSDLRDQEIYPVFEMRDIEHSLCEFDKYCRVKFGEGEPRGRYNGIT